MKCLYYTFAGMKCLITGPDRHISYIKKCYAKSPFATYMKTTSTGAGTYDAYLEIQVVPYRRKKDEFFRLSVSKDHRYFRLFCTEHLFFIFPIIEQVLRKIFYILFFSHDGFILHASALVYKKKAYIFVGDSGAGKSTIVKLIKKKHPETAIVADNNVCIRLVRKSYMLFPPAFLEWNLSTDAQKVLQFPIAGIFFLEKDTSLYTEKIDFPSLYKFFYAHVQIPMDHLSKKEIYIAKKNLLTFVGCFGNINRIRRLYFSLTKDPWSVISQFS